MASSGDIKQILSLARWNTLSSDTQAVLLQAWTTHTGGLKSELEKTRVDSEQRISSLQKKCQQLEAQVTEFKDEKEKGETALDEYREQAFSANATSVKLTQQINTLAAERDDYRRQFQNTKAERDDISGVSERRQEEIERLHTKVKDLTEERDQAVSLRCEAQARLEDLQSKEINIEFREKRLTEERTFLESQIQMLKDEVEKSNEEVLKTKRESGLRNIELTSEVADKTEQIRILSREKETATEDREAYRRKAEILTDRLKDARDSESKLEENYRAELKSQKKLADLYKEQSEENTQKTEELSNAVTKLQDMLKDAGDKYGQLEEKIEKVKADYKIELEKGNEAIINLKAELKNANKLIETVKNKGLTEDAIEHLSPSAAQASRLLKSGVTLTGIYSQMVSLSEELAMEKEENKRLNEYMDQILAEIEERAPILRQQREDYEHAMSAVGGLTESLEAAREEVGLRRREAEDARRDLKSVEKDRNKLEQQVIDLGKQITVLVKEVEAARSGGQVYEPPQTVNVSSLESVIEARLLTYKDVTELQQRNIELLAVVRQLSESREQAESSLIEEKTAEVRQELDTALRQAEELRAARERQNKMVDNLIKQRDLYKSMAAGKKDPTPASLAAVGQQGVTSEESAAKIEKLTAELEEARKDLSEYKKEKGENYRMLEKDCSRLRDELLEARSQAAKLSSQEEYNTQKFNIAKTNCESLKKQIEALEMRNKQMHSITEKHEESITKLREELLSQSRQLSHAELTTDRLSQENRHLKAIEARLSAERDVLHRERASTNTIMANLQQIQLNLERRDDQHRIKLTETNANLTKEVEMLRKKLDEEQDHFKASVRNWETANQELREKVAREENLAKDSTQRLTELSALMETMNTELKEKTEELQLAESRLAGRNLASQASISDSEGKNRYRDAEILMAKSKQEIKQLNNQLNSEKKKVEELKQLAETAEKRMAESSKAMEDCREEANIKIQKAEDEKTSAEKIAQDSFAKLKEMTKKIEDLEVEVGAEGGVLREKYKNACKDLEDMQQRVKQFEAQDFEMRVKMASLSSEAQEMQDKYQREILLHAKDIEALNQLKSETKDKMTNLEEIEADKARIEARVQQLKTVHSAEMADKSEELKAVQSQLELVTSQNEALMKQLESVSGQLSDLSASGHVLDTSHSAADTSMNVSISSIPEDGSNEKLMSIIKYLRKEKDIVTGRLEVKEAALATAIRQLEHARKQADDVHNAMEMERQERDSNLMTAGKHAELLRKVESLASLTDSNKLLREEKNKLDAIVNSAQLEAQQAKEKILPLENKIRDLEEKCSSLLIEKTGLVSETEEWKKRSDQLVEKSFKMNPEELKRLQDAETKLTKQINMLNADKQKAIQQANTVTKELANLKQSLANTQEELKTAKAEIEKRQTDTKIITTQKNTINNLNRKNNEMVKQNEALEKKHKEELQKLKTDLETSAAKAKEAGDGDEALKKQHQELEVKYKSLEEEQKKKATIIKNLKTLGKQFRDKSTSYEERVKELEAATQTKEKEISELKKKLETTEKELEEANALTEQLNPTEHLERIKEIETLKNNIEKLEEQKKKHDDKTKYLLGTMREKLSETKAENQKLKEDLKGNNVTAQIVELREDIEKMKTEKEKMKTALESRLKQVTNENLVLKTEVSDLQDMKTKLDEQIEQLQTQLETAATAAAKPVAVAGVVHQHEQRKQVQPQAHIPPHRHQPPQRDEFRPPQTASIRPMTQRSAAAVVLPTSQGSSAQPDAGSAVPVVSVSPSVSSAAAATPQLPSTSQLDPTAVEFIPGDRSAATSSDSTMAEEEPTESFRPDSVQASTSSPAPPTQSAQTSTSGQGATQTTASVQPTLKRAREVMENVVVEDASVAGPSGSIQHHQVKKAKLVALSVEHEVIAEQSNVADVDPSAADSQGEEVDLDFDDNTDNIVESSGGLADEVEVGGQPTEEMDYGGEDLEEGEVTEEEEEEIAGPEMVDVEAGAIERAPTGEGGEALDEEEEVDDGEPGLEPEALDANLFEDDGEDGENSNNVPSSSTGTTVTAGIAPGRSTFASSTANPPAVVVSGFEVEGSGVGEDSVVPGTPKLAEPRRQDDFSEAVSSPQVPTSFEFAAAAAGSSSSSSMQESIETSSGMASGGLSGQAGAADQTSYDISQLAQSDSRSPQPPQDLEESEASTGGQQLAEGLDSEEIDIEAAGEENEGGSGSTTAAASGATESEESGVSSSGGGGNASSGGRGRLQRKPITWSSPQEGEAGSSRQASGPASTSPQRTLNRSQLTRALRGTGLTKPTRGKRGGAAPK